MPREINQNKGNDCSFCSQITNNQMPNFYIEKTGISNRLLFESDNFIAVPSISPMAQGHILIIPKYHITSTCQIPKDDQDEFITFTNKSINFISRKYGNVILSEHGIGAGRDGGCGVKHAHLHIIPIKNDTSIVIKETIVESFEMSGPIHMNDFLLLKRLTDSYLLYGFNLGELYLTWSEKIPSQFLRKIICSSVGKAEWDWRKYFGWEDFIQTYNDLHTLR